MENNAASYYGNGAHILGGKMKRTKPLLPSEREKKRYLVLECISKKGLDFQTIKEGVQSAIKQYIGLLGEARAGVLFLKNTYDEKNQRFIIKVNRAYLDKVRASLLLVKTLNGEKALIRSVFCSGSLKKAKERLKNAGWN